MFVNRCYDMGNSEVDYNKPQMNMDMNMGMSNCCSQTCPPVMECPQERVCHVNTCYEVPHIIPINTRIINHHIYRHTYQPMYTCCMEDEVCNVYENNNCCF